MRHGVLASSLFLVMPPDRDDFCAAGLLASEVLHSSCRVLISLCCCTSHSTAILPGESEFVTLSKVDQRSQLAVGQ